MKMMANSPLVSIIIPTYSRPVYLKRCISSVLNQTYKNIEIIVVDDNDPETEARLETERVMKEYVSNRKIKYIRHERNKNGSAARNTGWKFAQGEYITYLDDDDEIVSSKIEKQVKCLEVLDCSWGACYTGYTLIKPQGKKQKSSEKRSGECYVDALMRTLYMGSGSNLLLRKSVVDEIEGYDESFLRNQDIEFMARALEHYKIAYLDEQLLIIHQDGIREKRSFEQIDSYSKHYLEKFRHRINALEEQDRNRVIGVISLERCRVAFSTKRFKEGIRILSENNVRTKMILKYIYYILHRMITHKSYGFDGR